MAGEWGAVTIEDVAQKVAMGPFGSRIKTENFVSDGVPVIRGNNLNAERFLDDKFAYLTETKADELSSANAFPLDIVVTHRGTLGQVGVIPLDADYERYVVSQSQMKITIDPSQADPIFVFYYLRSSEGQHQLLANSSQTGVPAIASPTKSVKAIVIPTPTLREQRAISQVLGTLDDKIELNRRMNETLEEMARAIFKSWFVDFDPVRAKAEGRDPGLPEHIADLFPDHLEDSELGEIPAGWKVGTLGDVAENPRRTIKPAQMEESAPYIGLEHLPRQSISLGDWESSEGLESNKYEFKRGEILFGKLRPYFHKVGIAPEDGICSTDILVVAAKQPEWFGFILEHLSSENFVNYTTATSSGTKMPRTNWKDMSSFRVVTPTSSLAKEFDVLVQPLIERILENIHETQTLAVTRDALLPRLISGELRAPDTSRSIEDWLIEARL